MADIRQLEAGVKENLSYFKSHQLIKGLKRLAKLNCAAKSPMLYLNFESIESEKG